MQGHLFRVAVGVAGGYEVAVQGVVRGKELRVTVVVHQQLTMDEEVGGHTWDALPVDCQWTLPVTDDHTVLAVPADSVAVDALLELSREIQHRPMLG